MNISNIFRDVDDVKNLIHIPIPSQIHVTNFMKDFKLIVDILTVIGSAILIAIFLYLMPYFKRGLKMHIHFQILTYSVMGFLAIYHLTIDATIILSYVYSSDEMSTRFGVPKSLTTLCCVEATCSAVYAVFLLGFLVERAVATVMVDTTTVMTNKNQWIGGYAVNNDLWGTFLPRA
uniref:G-protein coupled receptors family 1 profile domain-containing protein n=1 Tax=Panagrellus redivivus TaxID=6233 RepID=A0A7E4VHB0_PANRE